MDGQGTTWRRNIAENFNRLSRAHERYRRQTTDGLPMTYSEHELEFTFAKNVVNITSVCQYRRYIVLVILSKRPFTLLTLAALHDLYHPSVSHSALTHHVILARVVRPRFCSRWLCLSVRHARDPRLNGSR